VNAARARRWTAAAAALALFAAGCDQLGLGGDDDDAPAAHGKKRPKKKGKKHGYGHDPGGDDGDDGEGPIARPLGDGDDGDRDGDRDGDDAKLAKPAKPAAPEPGAPEPAAGRRPATPALAGAVAIVPALPPLEKGMMDHAHVRGWSKDGSEIGWCSTSGMSGGTSCAFLGPGGKVETLSDFDPGKGAAVPKRTKAIEARAAARGYGAAAADWPWGADLVLVWSAAGAADTPTLKVGARARDGRDPAWVVAIKAPPDFAEIHPEVIAVSPDGARLGVVSHAFGGEGSDTFAIKTASLAEAAGRAYNLAGFAHHKKKEWKEAAALFAKAAAADPSFGTAVYNLACALARLKDPGAEDALKRAIAIGGAKTSARARKDPDFELVRGEAWFVALTK